MFDNLLPCFLYELLTAVLYLDGTLMDQPEANSARSASARSIMRPIHFRIELGGGGSKMKETLG